MNMNKMKWKDGWMNNRQNARMLNKENNKLIDRQMDGWMLRPATC